MAAPGSTEPAGGNAAAGAEPDARQVRLLKIIVIGLGVLLLAGFALVIARIAYLATQPGRGIGAARAPQDVSVALPPGAVVRQTAVSGDRMTIQFESPQQTGIVIVNLTTGQIVSRIVLRPEAPRQ
ncbi:MAG: hypothetical protein KJZ80_03590 [Hyphomicrobiaceae bacterium]|nr:hypothetical protein [Hyphomicrobiaceae bacterium]